MRLFKVPNLEGEKDMSTFDPEDLFKQMREYNTGAQASAGGHPLRELHDPKTFHHTCQGCGEMFAAYTVAAILCSDCANGYAGTFEPLRRTGTHELEEHKGGYRDAPKRALATVPIPWWSRLLIWLFVFPKSSRAPLCEYCHPEPLWPHIRRGYVYDQNRKGAFAPSEWKKYGGGPWDGKTFCCAKCGDIWRR